MNAEEEVVVEEEEEGLLSSSLGGIVHAALMPNCSASSTALLPPMNRVPLVYPGVVLIS